MTEVPPPRYRVVERGRRLEVIDTAQDGRAPVRTRLDGGDAPAENTGLYVAVAKAVCANATDAQGRPIFATADWFDAKAPREIALGPAGQKRLALTALSIGAVAAMLIGLVFEEGAFGVVLSILVAGLTSRHGKSVATHWVDGFIPRA